MILQIDKPNPLSLVLHQLYKPFDLKVSSIEFVTGKVILEAVILTAVVVVSLTLYTFWAAKRGYDFNFLGPFLFGAIVVLMVFGFIQV